MSLLVSKKNLKVDAALPDGTTALMLSSFKGNENAVKKLIGASANVNAANRYGVTALMQASAQGHLGIVKLLLKAGATADLRDMSGRSAWDMAANHAVRAALSPRKPHQQPAAEPQKQ